MTANKVVVSDEVAYVVDSRGLQVVDVKKPSAPTLRGHFQQGNFQQDSIRSIADGDGTIYAGTGDRFLALNVSDPDSPVKFSEILVRGYGGCAVDGKLVYAYGEDLQVIDYTSPEAPVVRGIYNPTHDGWFYTPRDVAIGGGKAVIGFTVAYPREFHVLGVLETVDIRNPDELLGLGGDWYSPELSSIAMVDQFAYVVAGSLRVLDISDPNIPTSIAYHDISAGSIFVDNHFAYALGGSVEGRLNIFDVRIPAAPVFRGSYPVSGRDVYADEGYIYVASGEDGLYVLQYTNTSWILY